MTSTNTFQGLGSDSKPSSRVLRPPGGGSSNVFGSDDSSSSPSRSHKMASNIFAAPEESQSSPKRTNPPGGKTSGIFGQGDSSASKPAQTAAVGSSIFSDAPVSPPTFRNYPSKPKDNIGINALPGPDASSKKEPPQVPVPPPKQEESSSSCQSTGDVHEPHLGPRPRSHNKVLQPPGGKSSVVFY